MGFENVFALKGGVGAWRASGFDVEKGAPRELVFGLDDARRRVTFIDGPTLTTRLGESDVFILDVGLSTEYSRGHVAGAAWLSRDWLEERMPALYPDRRRPIVVACPDGRHSTLAAGALAGLGYLNVAVLEGGTNEWIARGRPAETGLVRPLVEPNDVVLSASMSGDKDAMRRYLDWELELGRKA